MAEGIEESRRWLAWLYGPEPDGLLWVGGHADGWKGRTFTSIDDAAEYGSELDAKGVGKEWGVYHRLSTMRKVEKGRGAAVDAAYLPAFAMDLDLRGPGHKAMNYPETEQDLITLLRKAGLPEPSVWVHSGGGRYPFWKLDQPEDLTLPGHLETAATTSAALHKLVIGWADQSGWKVDNTSDLARVYRLPGTHNRKAGGQVVCSVAWQESNTATFALSDMTTSVSKAPDPAPPPSTNSAELPGQLPGMDARTESQLFGVQLDDDRRFTLAEAMAYCQPALDALRGAADGEINNRLNDAAVRLAHFGEEFWSREAAERQLLAALEHTAYDAATWQAETTIASAYNAIATKDGPEFWRGILKPSPPTEEQMAQAVADASDEAVDALLAEMLTPGQIKDRPGKKYLIKGLLNLDSESWIIGAPGARKSFVVLDMAAHVAEGMPWQGRPVNGGPVVIIAAEGAGGLSARIRAWEIETGRTMSERLIVLPRPIQVTNAAAWAVLVKACARIGAVMTVIDTQARVTAGLDENSSQLGVFVGAMTAVRVATGGCVLAVHHTSKAGQDARGHSVIDGAQDTELKVVAGAEKLTGELRIDKQKDLEQLDPIPLRFAVHVVGQDEDGDPVTSLALRSGDAWRDAAGEVEAVDVGQVQTISEPLPWIVATCPSYAVIQHRILQVLLDVAGLAGLTEAKVLALVAERWHGGQVGRGAGKLNRQGFQKAWQHVIDRDEVIRGEVGSASWTLDPEWVKTEPKWFGEQDPAYRSKTPRSGD